MTIPDKAIEAAALAIYSDATIKTMDEANYFAKAALTAALPYLPKQPPVNELSKGLAREEGFRAGIEAAAKLADMGGWDRDELAAAIRALADERKV